MKPIQYTTQKNDWGTILAFNYKIRKKIETDTKFIDLLKFQKKRSLIFFYFSFMWKLDETGGLVLVYLASKINWLMVALNKIMKPPVLANKMKTAAWSKKWTGGLAVALWNKPRQFHRVSCYTDKKR